MKHTEHTLLGRWMALAILAAAQARAEEHGVTGQRIVVSIADRKLALLEGTTVVKVYDVAVGKPSTPSPNGEFRIVARIPNPTWYGPEKVVGPGKANPLGTRWLGLSVAGYGIHGTNRPESIGKAASKGCIRMRNEDVEELFELVRVGATVELAGESSVWVMNTTEGEQNHAGVEISADRGGRAAAGGRGDDSRL